ncbi:hypothetical protein [Deinococcus proteolyticus]|uniref:hypothetical protein n=1 Tax=Deinococcus proteolyticus TaxID=55148 RepID=UPI0011D2385C|nr:hypothetical protein [Deinococcus proteolyticus]
MLVSVSFSAKNGSRTRFVFGLAAIPELVAVCEVVAALALAWKLGCVWDALAISGAGSTVSVSVVLVVCTVLVV